MACQANLSICRYAPVTLQLATPMTFLLLRSQTKGLMSGRAIGSRGLAPTTAATGQMIIFSAGSGQQALDKLGPNDKNPNGLFTRMLLSEMRAPGIRVDNMIREVRRKVVDAAK